MACTAELIDLTRQDVDFSRDQINTIVTAFLDVLQEVLANGEDVKLQGIGYFHLVPVKEQTKTLLGQKKVIPPHTRVTFHPYEQLRKRVWDLEL